MNNREKFREDALAVGGLEAEEDGDDMDLEFCDHCGEDFRYDDTGGYNPPCECGLNCASCCERGACDRERDDRDDEDGGSDG